MDKKNLELLLEEKTRCLEQVQRTLDYHRELSLKQLKDTQRESDQQIELIKTDYELNINRNYKLIDELIEEKKTLHAKCEALMMELKSSTKKFETSLKNLEEK